MSELEIYGANPYLPALIDPSHDGPPADFAAEQAVLGSMLLDNRTIPDLASSLPPADFYRPSHEVICGVIYDLAQKRKPADVEHVAGELQRIGELPKVGGALYLHTLMQAPSVAANAPHYADIVRQKAILRRVITACNGIAGRAAAAEDAAAFAEDARALIDEATTNQVSTDQTVDAGPLLTETLDALESGLVAGVPTGWPDLDSVATLRPGQLTIVGARPGVGKSVIAANLAIHAARNGVGVHFASLEMTRHEVMQRMLSSLASVQLDHIVSGNLDEGEWSRVGERSSQIYEWPLRVDDTPSQTLLALRSRARSTARKFPLGIIVVDYLQLMAPRDRRVQREQQVGELSEGLKGLAKELGVVVVALAQVNRGPMDRQDKRPAMSDLRESGRIEADADHIWLLHRQDLVDPNSTTGEIEVAVAKNRNGSSGRVVSLSFQGHFSRAVSPARAWTPSGGVA